jgi:hypothetical protein
MPTPQPVDEMHGTPAGRAVPARRSTRRIVLLAILVCVLVASAGLVGRAGLVTPRLGWPEDGRSYGYAYERGTVSRDMKIVNSGWAPVRVLSVGRSGPGIDLVEAVGAPITLTPGGSAGFYLEFTITDCGAVPAGEWPVPIRVERPWGTSTVYVDGLRRHANH